MTKTRHMIASAPIAIAAMAALHVPAATAQDTPTIVLDMPAPAPAPATSQAVAPAPIASPAPIVLPAPTPAPITIELPEPVPVVDAPAVKEAEPVATTQTTRRAAPQPRSEPAPAASTMTSEQAAAEAAPLPVEEPFASANNAESQPLATAEPATDPASDPSSAALLLALLGLGGIALAGAFLLVRRRREEEVPVIERPIVAQAAPVDAEAQDRIYDVEPLRTMRPEPVAPLATNSDAPVELPTEKPRDPAQRDRLLKRMIEAEPDRANPFVSHKARAKRARLILQSIGTRFTDRKPGIDLSQYTNVWPELRGWRPATA